MYRLNITSNQKRSKPCTLTAIARHGSQNKSNYMNMNWKEIAVIGFSHAVNEFTAICTPVLPYLYMYIFVNYL